MAKSARLLEDFFAFDGIAFGLASDDSGRLEHQLELIDRVPFVLRRTGLDFAPTLLQALLQTGVLQPSHLSKLVKRDLFRVNASSLYGVYQRIRPGWAAA